MHRCQPGASFARDEFAALFGHAKIFSQHSLRRGCAQTNHDFGPHRFQFGIEPRSAGGNLQRIRLLVDAAFAARLPLEMLHRIGDENLFAVDAHLIESFIEHATGRADEGMPGEIFFIARLLAQK